MYALLLLAVLVFSAFTPSTRQNGSTALNRATIAVAEEVGLTSDALDQHLMTVRGEAADAELAGTVYPNDGLTEKVDGLPWGQAPHNRWSSCWWLWVYTGSRLCS